VRQISHNCSRFSNCRARSYAICKATKDFGEQTDAYVQDSAAGAGERAEVVAETYKTRRALLRFRDRAIGWLSESRPVFGAASARMGDLHEANFVLDYLYGSIGMRYGLCVAAR
jgi:hypothetical protein